MSRVGPERRRGCSRRRDHGRRRRRRGALDGVIRPVRVSGLITVFAVWMIHLRGSQPPSKAILQQDFVASLLLILIGIGSRGHLAGLRRSAGSGPIGSARRQIVSPGTWGRSPTFVPEAQWCGLGDAGTRAALISAGPQRLRPAAERRASRHSASRTGPSRTRPTASQERLDCWRTG